MLFAHDTEVALAAAAALVNTRPDRPDDAVEELPDVAALDRFVTEWGWTGSRASGSRARATELAQVQQLRDRLLPVWTTSTDEAVEVVNALLREANAMPQLIRHDEWDYHLHATDPSAPLAERMAVEAAMALVDVIRSGELDRLRLCAAEDCADVLVDLSKNSSRRFCERGCGNRANVAAYRRRQRAEAGGPSVG